MSSRTNAERERLAQASAREGAWRRWGPYLSERQWGTVREDYSANGDAWSSFPHEHARSRAYRWGEDGLLGICDDKGYLCFALALWNEHDPILKERLFGLTNPEGNHGEDVKECYYYLDATPTASYLKGLYKYPAQAFPYQELLETNRGRSKELPEHELLDTGIFDTQAYFDVFVEYAKADAEDIFVRVTIHNRSRRPLALHVLPTLWFRNTWSWHGGLEREIPEPSLSVAGDRQISAEHAELGRFTLSYDRGPDGDWPELLFTDNVTNTRALYGDAAGPRYAKDAFHRYLVQRDRDAVNPERHGTKAAAHYTLVVSPDAPAELRLRLCRDRGEPITLDKRRCDEVFAARRRDTDDFYADHALPGDEDTLRQGCAGLIWSKQLYYYVVKDWLAGDPLLAPPDERLHGRNADWRHVCCRDVISMPDKWEFPWFASWDLAFHMILFGFLDPQFARDQLLLILGERYFHPSGQLPAYEYNFGDVNPPVHAWACLHLYRRFERQGTIDSDFLKRAFNKLLLNFSWWVNRKDSAGRNLFGGGFLGLDNIGVFDRSMPLPAGVELEQADGTAWMAMFSTSMLTMAFELAETDPAYEDLALKFLDHFASISASLNRVGGNGMWHEEDGFYYDQLLTGERTVPLRVRSLVGMLPLVACAVFDRQSQKVSDDLKQRLLWLKEQTPDVAERLQVRDVTFADGSSGKRWLLALAPRPNLERMLRVLFDENEFLSPHGIRSISRYHLEHPFVFEARGQRFEVKYLPGESDSWMFGGNSNWRGPVWVPINMLIIEALLTYHRFYGDDLRVELPTGSGRQVTLREAALELAARLVGLMRVGPDGARPVHGSDRRYADDAHFRELLLFYEYYHGDSGRGCGANHQTGWSALIAAMAYLLREAEEGRLRS